MKKTFRDILNESKENYEYKIYITADYAIDVFKINGKNLSNFTVSKMDFLNSELMNSEKYFPSTKGRNVCLYNLTLDYMINPEIIRFELSAFYNINMEYIKVEPKFEFNEIEKEIIKSNEKYVFQLLNHF